jgi:hypothetical protein
MHQLHHAARAGKNAAMNRVMSRNGLHYGQELDELSVMMTSDPL